MPDALLTLSGVHTHIGQYHILQGVDLVVPRGGLSVLLGRNGAGKTTTLRTIMGLWRASAGSIVFDGRDISKMATPDIAQAGIAYVPESMAVFSELTVRENMLLAARNGPLDQARVDWICGFFPALKKFWHYPAGKLSGGQKQMVAIGRALAEPRKLLLVDEPTKGLAPAIIHSLIAAFAELKALGHHHPAGRAELQCRQNAGRHGRRDGRRPRRARGRDGRPGRRPRPATAPARALRSTRTNKPNHDDDCSPRHRCRCPPARRDLAPLLLVPALLLLMLPLVGSLPTWLTLTVAGLAMGMMIFLMASGLTLVFGLMDVLNFGHGAFVAVGAYAATLVLIPMHGWLEADSLLQNLAVLALAMLAWRCWSRPYWAGRSSASSSCPSTASI